jgi:peroxiredoxin
MPNTPLTRRRAPALDVETLDGPWRLDERSPRTFTLLVFYRGLHCPICAKYVPEIDARLDELEQRGVEVLALSADDRDRAARSREDWGIGRLPIAYGVTPEQMREWGLYLSEAIKEGEPAVFCEPAAFLVEPDGMLWLAAVTSAPFARPHLEDLLAAVDMATENDYPARGELDVEAVV